MGVQERAEQLIVRELGELPEQFSALRDYFRQINDLVHYYLEKFGPYMIFEKRKELAKACLEADAIFLRLERLNYRLQKISSVARAHVRLKRGRKFVVDEKEKEELRRELESLEEDVNAFARKVEGIIKEIQRVVNERGIE